MRGNYLPRCQVGKIMMKQGGLEVVQSLFSYQWISADGFLVPISTCHWDDAARFTELFFIMSSIWNHESGSWWSFVISIGRESCSSGCSVHGQGNFLRPGSEYRILEFARMGVHYLLLALEHSITSRGLRIASLSHSKRFCFLWPFSDMTEHALPEVMKIG